MLRNFSVFFNVLPVLLPSFLPYALPQINKKQQNAVGVSSPGQPDRHCLANISVKHACAFGHHDKHCLKSKFWLSMFSKYFKNIFCLSQAKNVCQAVVCVVAKRQTLCLTSKIQMFAKQSLSVCAALQILICCHENTRFTSIVLFRSGLTIERVERTVGNCRRNLIFKMNLWKGVFILKWCHLHFNKGCGLEFVMKYYILHVFRTYIVFEEKSSSQIKDLLKLKHLTNLNVSPGT